MLSFPGVPFFKLSWRHAGVLLELIGIEIRILLGHAEIAFSHTLNPFISDDGIAAIFLIQVEVLVLDDQFHRRVKA